MSDPEAVSEPERAEYERQREWLLAEARWERDEAVREKRALEADCRRLVDDFTKAEAENRALEAEVLAQETGRKLALKRNRALVDRLRQAEFDVAVPIAELREENRALVEALERLLRNAERIFDKEPVRDWDETLHEARAALPPQEPKR